MHADLLEDLLARVALCFARRETRLTCRDMVNGLLSELDDYNCWTLAEAADEESSADCAGAARQYGGTVGGIAMCQVAVTLTCASPAGHALIGRALYLPGGQAADKERRERAGVPDEVMFATKPQLAGHLLQHADDRGIRAGFVTGDEVYGGLDLRIAVAPFVLTDFDTGELGSARHHFGVSYWGGIGETALIGYFPGEQGDRDRYTVGHELAHLVLHTFRPRPVNAEDEANRFAGALLLPKDRILSDVSDRLSLEGYTRLKATWGTSIQAIIMRSSQLGAIGDVRKRSLFVQLSQRGWRKQEPVLVGQESPLLLWKLLTRRFGDRPYRTASDGLAIHPAVLRSIARYLSPTFRRIPRRHGREPWSGSSAGQGGKR